MTNSLLAEWDIASIRHRLRASGYACVMRKTYGYPVTLELYARPRADADCAAGTGGRRSIP